MDCTNTNMPEVPAVPANDDQPTTPNDQAPEAASPPPRRRRFGKRWEPTTPGELHPRLVEALFWAARGMQLRDAPANIGIARDTAKHYRYQAVRQLGGRSITHAVVLALKAGVLDLAAVANDE